MHTMTDAIDDDAGPDRSPMKRWYTDIATTATEPPSHIGVPAQ
jgi:hypothetical protein